jgi:4-hydroxy-4-methyl-2-oxoglutarate aldolase
LGQKVKDIRLDSRLNKSMKIEPIPAQYLELLRKYDSPTVANVIELFNVRSQSVGFADHRIRAMFPDMGPVVGYATTATYRTANPPTPTRAYPVIADWIARYEEEIPRPRIVVTQDLDDTPCAALFGDIMCSTHQRFGCAALVTSGCIRDLDQVHEKGFPCFASGINASHGYCHLVDFHVPVTIGGLGILPGNLLHADRNGVVSVPNEIAPQVALCCERVAETEGEVLEYVERHSSPTPDGVREAFKRMKNGFARIAAEVQEELRS